jgi:hypothetical protein
VSNRVLSAAFRYSQAKGAARLVLLAMADEANDQGLLTAYRRSYSHLGSKANVDAATVRRAIRTLEELGEVAVLVRGDGRESSHYRIDLPDLDHVEGRQPAHPGSANGLARVGESPTQGGPDAHPIIPFSPGDTPESPKDSSAVAFGEFWDAYPRKVGKPEAEKAWRAVVAKDDVASSDVLVGLDRWKAYWRSARTEPTFIPHPSTWLRQRRWEDQPPPVNISRGGQRGPVLSDRSRPSGVVEL